MVRKGFSKEMYMVVPEWRIHTDCCMVLRGTFDTAPEQEQGPEQGQGRMGYVPIF